MPSRLFEHDIRKFECAWFGKMREAIFMLAVALVSFRSLIERNAMDGTILVEMRFVSRWWNSQKNPFKASEDKWTRVPSCGVGSPWITQGNCKPRIWHHSQKRLPCVGFVMWNSVCEKIGDQTRIEPSIAVQVLPKNAVRHGWGANPHTAALHYVALASLTVSSATLLAEQKLLIPSFPMYTNPKQAFWLWPCFYYCDA